MRKRPRKGQPEERSPSRSGGARIVRHGTPPTESGAVTAEGIRRLKPLGEPRRVRVVTDSDGAPLRVSPDGSWRSVLTIRERWRIDDEWWRRPLSREYFEVVLQDGRVVELYRDLERDTWHAHGGGSAFADRSQ